MKWRWLTACVVVAIVECQQQKGRPEEVVKCKTPGRRDGTCVPFTSCQSLVDLLISAKDDDKRQIKAYLQQSRCLKHKPNNHVCCAELQPASKPQPTCGINNPVDKIKITHGQEAQLGAWPWIAALGYSGSRDSKYLWLCAGTLITDKHIITAAHCFADNRKGKTLKIARLGELNLDDDINDGAQPQDIPISTGILHPNFEQDLHRGSKNDIGILILRTSVKFTRFIQPICLPPKQNSRTKDFVNSGQDPYVAGWGRTEYDGPTSKALLQAIIPVVDRAKCLQNYRLIYPHLQLYGNQICAGDEHDACQGDSGGPLMTFSGNRWFLIGVVSFGGLTCGNPDFPGIYTRVDTYLDWIGDVIRKK